jgi:hypothetical protein
MDKREYGITISFFEKATKDYPYDIVSKMELASDIDAEKAILAFIRVLKMATYHPTWETLQRIADDMKDGGV